MSKTTTNLLLMLFTIIVGTYAYITFCSECYAEANQVPTEKDEVVSEVEEQIPMATSYPLDLDDGDFKYRTQDNFNFNSSSSGILEPLANGVKEGIDSLKSHLLENTSKTINVIGYYKSSENNDSAFPNIGIARANAVKNYFVDQGIPSSQINTESELKDDMIPKDNVFQGPISYSLHQTSDTLAEEMEALYEKIKANPLILQFETGQTAIALSTSQRQKIADISRYLDKIESATCGVIGHTDNDGSRNFNIQLGQERADFIKNYLINAGLSASKIVASSQGPDNPIATNATSEGQAQNRRVEVTLNK